MYIDILIFAVVAAILVYRLKAVLGTRPDDDDASPRPNPFAAAEVPKRNLKLAPAPKTAAAPSPLAGAEQLIDPAANKDRRIETGLEEIAAVDPGFTAADFMAGAKYAFETVVTAYSRGDRAQLRQLLSEKLYADFESEIATREGLGRKVETTLHRIKAARIIEAHLGGAMAYITVDYDVEQTSVTRDSAGAIVEGNPDSITNVEDIWTFTRDTRSTDPNWILIETRAAEK